MNPALIFWFIFYQEKRTEGIVQNARLCRKKRCLRMMLTESTQSVST